jgi:hypothetical protein
VLATLTSAPGEWIQTTGIQDNNWTLQVVASEADWEKLAKDIRDKPGRGRVHIERRAKLRGQEHVPPGLLRLSVGCEHVEDLWDDLNAALTAAMPVAGASAAAASAPARNPSRSAILRSRFTRTFCVKLPVT